MTSRPILIVLNKVDLLRGEHSINQIHTTVMESNIMKVLDINYNYTNTVSIEKPEIKLSFKQKLLQRKKASLQIFDENESEKNIVSINEIKERIQEEVENTDYSDYKDDYNEKEAENDRNWKGSVRSEASEKHLKAKSMSELEVIWKQRLPRAEIQLISAQNKIGIQSLLERIVGFMPQGPKFFTKDTLTNRDERFFTTEIIRETIFHIYKDEIPYSCEVIIDQFQDKSPQLSVIDACIIVNKDSQKAIIIGKGGLKLKELGSMAREKLEKFLDRKVFLSLHVRVDEDWRQNENSLARYGYVESDFG